MPRFNVETTAQVRRIYSIVADTAEEAKEIASNCGIDHMLHEEDISEEIDGVTLSTDQEDLCEEPEQFEPADE